MSSIGPRHPTTAGTEYSKTAETQGKDPKTTQMKMIVVLEDEINKSLEDIQEKHKPTMEEMNIPLKQSQQIADGRSLGSSLCVSLQIKDTDLAMARKAGQGKKEEESRARHQEEKTPDRHEDKM
ncbi:hypothetical protein STEG23_017196 [Scotinomys teguina]